MAIYKGTRKIQELIKGTTQIKKVYKGEDLVYSKRVPIGYTEVNYIKSSGTQYINTGVAPSQASDDLVIEMKYSLSSASIGSTDNMMFGATDQTDGGGFSFYFDVTSSKKAYMRSYAKTTGAYIVDNFYDDYPSATLKFSKDGLYVNDVFVASSTPTIEGNLTYELFIFGRNRDNVFNLPCSFELYHCKISKGGIVVSELIPCIRDADSAVGMYDIVRDTFFENSGTGDFIYG